MNLFPFLFNLRVNTSIAKKLVILILDLVLLFLKDLSDVELPVTYLADFATKHFFVFWKPSSFESALLAEGEGTKLTKK